VPFKSEAQRRYLWANEPEIARDWTDTYGSRVYKNTGGISQLVKSSGDGKRPGYGGPQDWGQQERAEKAAAGQGPAVGSDNPYHGMSHSDLQNLSKHSPSHGGMHTDWSRDPNYRDAGFRGPPVVDQKAIDEAKEVDWTNKNKPNAWTKGINAWNNYHNTKNLEWARKNKAKKDQALRDYIDSKLSTNPHMDVDEIMEGLAGSWDQKTGTFGTHEFTEGINKGTTFDLSNYGFDTDETGDKFGIQTTQLGPFGLSNVGKTGKKLGSNYIDSTGDFSTIGMTPVALQALGFSKPNFNTLKSHFNRTSLLDDLINKGGDLTQGDIDAYLDKTNPKRHGGGDGGNNPLWQRLGYPSYEAYMAAMNRSGGGGGGETDEDTDWRTEQWNFDTVYPYPNYKDGGRIPRAFGGIMDTNTGRKAYGLGSIFKSVKKAAKKVLSSDVGKMAMLAGGAYLAGGWLPGGGGITGGWSNFSNLGKHMFLKSGTNWGDKGALSLGKILGWSAALPFIPGINKAPENENIDTARRGGHLIDPITGKESLPKEMRTTLNTAIEEAGNDPTKLAAIEDAYPYLNLGQYLPYETYGVKDGGRIGFRYGKNYKKATSSLNMPAIYEEAQWLVDHGAAPTLSQAIDMVLTTKFKSHESPERSKPFKFSEEMIADIMSDKYPSQIKDSPFNIQVPNKNIDSEFIIKDEISNIDPKFTLPMPEGWETARANGGRIRAQEGGLMDLGGMEKDYRNNGGFVPIGGEERADDVPARLSRNEFVFTADAVRGAGGGDIDKGAEIMENVMKNLEQGGKISEETQGNAGAQQMFGVSERIGEVI
jgi:hypothetical protein